MPCPGEGPCGPWDLDLGCCLGPSGSTTDPCNTPITQDIVDTARLIASQFMWAKTGRQFGCCQVVLRPCRSCDNECCLPQFDGWGSQIGYGYPWYPLHLADGSWTNVACGCQDSCSCTELCKIELPYPVCSVDEVKIDGKIVDPATYKVYNFKELVYTSLPEGVGPASGTVAPSGCWPKCNDLNKSDDEVGTWSVKVTYGREIPELVRRGAEQFACEIIKSCTGRPCQLPQRIQSISRQGVSATFLDPMEFLSFGFTGLFMVDLAIKTYNPKGLQKKPQVYSPDVGKRWDVQTWTNTDPTGPNCR